MAATQRSQSLDLSSRYAYWKVVEDCLVKFHKIELAMAQSRAFALRAKVDSPQSGIAEETFYHAEPFYVACDLAGLHDSPQQETLLSQKRSAYDTILKKRDW